MKTAVLLPCLNEGPAIVSVIAGFRAALPDADIYVYDNASIDDTFEAASREGAVVRRAMDRGKGAVVRKMFAEIDADVYILADGDCTYDAADSPKMLERFRRDNLDMLVGSRAVDHIASVSRPGHALGNRLLTGMLNFLFGRRFYDVLSGYRIMSRRLVKSCAILSDGFEVEVLITLHALEMRAVVAETDVAYSTRAEGTHSTLRTVRDGARIVGTMIYMFKEIKPFLFFFLMALVFVAGGLFFGLPVITEFMQTGLVPRFPSAILASALMLMAAISLSAGVILDTVARMRIENKRLHFQRIE